MKIPFAIAAKTAASLGDVAGIVCSLTGQDKQIYMSYFEEHCADCPETSAELLEVVRRDLEFLLERIKAGQVPVGSDDMPTQIWNQRAGEC